MSPIAAALAGLVHQAMVERQKHLNDLAVQRGDTPAWHERHPLLMAVCCYLGGIAALLVGLYLLGQYIILWDVAHKHGITGMTRFHLLFTAPFLLICAVNYWLAERRWKVKNNHVGHHLEPRR